MGLASNRGLQGSTTWTGCWLCWFLLALDLDSRPLTVDPWCQVYTLLPCVYTHPLCLFLPPKYPSLQLWEGLPSTVTHLHSEASWVGEVGQLSFCFQQQNGLLDFLYERGPYFPWHVIYLTTTVKMVLLPLSQTHIEESLWPYSAGCKNHEPQEGFRKITATSSEKVKWTSLDPWRPLSILFPNDSTASQLQQVILSRLDPSIKSLSVQCDPQSSLGQRVSCFAFFQVNNSKQGPVPFLDKITTERQSVHTGVSSTNCLACGAESLIWWERSGWDSDALFWFGVFCSNLFSFCSTISCSQCFVACFKNIRIFFGGGQVVKRIRAWGKGY